MSDGSFIHPGNIIMIQINHLSFKMIQNLEIEPYIANTTLQRLQYFLIWQLSPAVVLYAAWYVRLHERSIQLQSWEFVSCLPFLFPLIVQDRFVLFESMHRPPAYQNTAI